LDKRGHHFLVILVEPLFKEVFDSSSRQRRVVVAGLIITVVVAAIIKATASRSGSIIPLRQVRPALSCMMTTTTSASHIGHRMIVWISPTLLPCVTWLIAKNARSTQVSARLII